MVALLLAAAVVGLGLAIWASRRAVDAVSQLALGFGVSPFVVGLVILSIGTDLPEIANSIVASVNGNGDINVGDSVGSAVAQLTLVLGSLPFFVGAFAVSKSRIRAVGLATVGVLVLLAFVTADGALSRTDGLLLVGLWIVITTLLATRRLVASEPALTVQPSRSGRLVIVTVVFLLAVTAGAMVAVFSLIEVAELLGVSEFAISFFGLAIGTSLPEFIIDITALRRGQRDLAIGDIFGSSLVDVTLSVGIGPAIAPVLVTAVYARWASLLAAGAILAVTVILITRPRHTRWTGLALLVIYGLMYPLLLRL